MSLFSVEEQIEKDEKKQEKGEKKTIKKTATKEKKVKILEPEETNEVLRYELKKIASFEDVGRSLVEQFKNNKLHHAIMLSGDCGIGKATFAYSIIAEFFKCMCESFPEEKRESLKKMHIELLQKNNHPDVFFLTKKDKENEIKVEQVRELIGRISFKPMYRDKFVIIDDINSINTNGVNALLKTLEEPPDNTYFFLINHKSTKLLDTIYSRCHEITLRLSFEECKGILKDFGFNDDDADFYSKISGSSVGFAFILKDFNAKKLFNEVMSATIPQKLNMFYEVIEANCKSLQRTIKLLLLERLMIFFIGLDISKQKENEEECGKIVLSNNAVMRQFLDIKRFELPVVFV